MTIAIVDDELETRQYMQGLVAQYLAETGRMAQLVFYPDGASFRRVRASGHCADGH